MNAAVKHGVILAGVVVGVGAVVAGCLTRPVAAGNPSTQTQVAIQVPNQVINKIDMLFDIDNSASMGDKQQYLIQAIPDLVDGLVNPNCIDNATSAITGKSMQGAGCPAGSNPEFPAVKDMHIGIVSSALGSRLSEIDPTGVNGVCNDPQQAQMPFQAINAHMDDKAHLITRSLTGVAPNLVEGTVADAASGFLYWYPVVGGMGRNGPPTGPATPIGVAGMPGVGGAMGTGLEGDFASIVSGVGVFGCGIESQMESWYRFLVQPDPYATLLANPAKPASQQPTAEWVGVDSTIIQERHDFLRPDSLVAVVVLSDENDSEIDVRSLGGLGYFFMRTTFEPPHGTSICATNAADPGCASCTPGSKDPACVGPNGTVAVYSAPNDWGRDPNLRHVHMRQKYGIDPQFPVERYFYGLTSALIPNRDGEYPPGANGYSGFGTNMKCTNPLYAASLPQQKDLSTAIGTATPVSAADAMALCNLPTGTRTSDKVFFAHIGGVPHQLLHFQAGNPLASTLTAADWTRILGTDPEHYNYNGIDPHMYESYTPRLPPTGGGEGLANPPTFDTSMTNALAPTGSPSTTDPVNGREWITDLPVGQHVLPVDRQFACTFPLATPRDCTLMVNQYACDCPPTPLTHDQTPPVCSDTTPTMQIAAKAYPTERELLVAKMMGVQGIVSSICPTHVTDNAQGNDPDYGYRPAVAAIIDRLKAALSNACLPRKLNVQPDGSVQCLVLVTLPGNGSCINPTCPAGMGLTVPGADVLKTFCDAQEASYAGTKGAPGDPADQSVCELTQLVPGQAPAGDFENGSCSNATDKGWCYVEGAGANGCSQAIVFSPGSPPSGSLTSLSCIEHSTVVVGVDGGP
jgi:hypothetical protein